MIVITIQIMKLIKGGKQNKTKQNKTKQNKTIFFLFKFLIKKNENYIWI